MNDSGETRIALAVLPAESDESGLPRYWLERRPDSAHLAGMLAFPGGKCLPDESPEIALARELQEELGILPQAPRLLMEIPWIYPAQSSEREGVVQSKRLRLFVYHVDSWQGELQCREGQTVLPISLNCQQPSEWMTALPPANRGIVAVLCLPPRIAITPACGAGDAGFSTWLKGLAHTANTLRQRFGVHGAIVQLRPDRDLTINQWREAVQIVRAQALSAWVNADWDVAYGCHADGIHLNRYRLCAVSRETVADWRAENRWIGASCHALDDVYQANEIGVDALLVSPILPTPSHPEATGIGWSNFAELTREATMPTYALGGTTEAQMSRTQRLCGQGVAAIRAYWGD